MEGTDFTISLDDVRGWDREPRACPRWEFHRRPWLLAEGEDRCQPLWMVSQSWCVLAVGSSTGCILHSVPSGGEGIIVLTANYPHKEPFEDNGQLTVKDNEDRWSGEYSWRERPLSSLGRWSQFRVLSLQCAQDNEKCLKHVLLEALVSLISVLHAFFLASRLHWRVPSPTDLIIPCLLLYSDPGQCSSGVCCKGSGPKPAFLPPVSAPFLLLNTCLSTHRVFATQV